MIHLVRQAIECHGMVRPGDTLLASVSGGPDSMALLEALWRLSSQLDFGLEVAHVDHGLRGEDSAADARLVAQAAHQRSLPFHLEEVDTREASRRWKTSVQDAAHRLRKESLDRTCRLRSLDRVAVGHHLDDHVETVLLHFLRGAGPDGLSGLRPVDGKTIRPLIHLNREQIISFCGEEKLPYRVDESNTDRKYLRNRIRLDLLPLLEREYSPGIRAVMARTADLMSDVASYLETRGQQALADITLERDQGRIILSQPGLFSLPSALQTWVVRECFRQLAGDLRDLDYQHVVSILELWRQGRTGSSVDLPRNLRAWVDSRGAAVGTPDSLAQAVAIRREPYQYLLSLPGQVRVKEAGLVVEGELLEAPDPLSGLADEGWVWDAPRGSFQFLARQVCIDYNKVDLPLVVRNRRKGDWFRPLGLGGRKKIKDFFISEKVPPALRELIPLVCSGDRVVWVAGMRLDEDFKIEDETTSAARLRVSGFRRV